MKSMLVAAAIAAVAGSASASAVFKNLEYSWGVQVQTSEGAYNTAGFNITTDSSSSVADFVGWCVQLEQVFSNNKTYVETTSLLPQYKFDRLDALVNGAYGNVDLGNKYQVAGFQSAVWESIYEDENVALNISTGDFHLTAASTSNQTQAMSFAAAFLDDAANWDGVTRYDWSHNTSAASQDLIAIAPVPIPAAGLLAAAAFAGLGLMGRRRKAA